MLLVSTLVMKNPKRSPDPDVVGEPKPPEPEPDVHKPEPDPDPGPGDELRELIKPIINKPASWLFIPRA